MSVLEGLNVGFEFETHPRDGQDLLRRMNQKRRDGHVDRMVLVLADTAANRLFLVDHGAALREAFPTPAADVIRALRGGRAPGDGVIVVRPRPRARSPAEEDAGRRQPAGRRSRRTGVGSG